MPLALTALAPAGYNPKEQIMKKTALFSILTTTAALALTLATAACGSDSGGNGEGGAEEPESLKPANAEKKLDMALYAHYMPWFETPQTNGGQWGMHWKMDKMNPDNISADGRREIASHYYPLTGPYASSDPAVLDYQCLLMKYSGIDGVMADWYGTQQSGDAPQIERNTQALLKAVEKAQLKLAIVYEDSPLSSAPDKVAQARLDMKHLTLSYFKSPSYARVDGRPLLLIFGPQQIETPREWKRVFDILATKPLFIVLNGHSQKVNDGSYTNSAGEFSWVNPNPDYEQAKHGFSFYIAGAMPGFNDFYRQGGWGSGYTSYDDEGGALFARQLEAARQAGMKWLQISTWNDYGEGTIIEPTREFGYRYLTALQAYTGVSYGVSHLEAIHRWYTLKVKYASDAAKTRTLDRCYALFNALMPDKAEQLMQGL